MDPPGRFLKKCPNAGNWEELSMKEAATRTSQAMAYAVRERVKQGKERRSLRLKSNTVGAQSSQPAEDPPRLPSYVNISTVSASTARKSAETDRGGEGGSDADSFASNEDDGNKLGGNNEIPIPPANPSLQQQLLQLQQQSSTTAPLPANNAGVLNNSLVQLLAQAQLQQQQQQQHQQLLRQLVGQFPLGLQTQLPSASLSSTLSMSTPSLSAQGTLLPSINSDILRQASALPQGSTLMNSLQHSNLLQNQAQSQSSSLNTNSLLGLMGMLQNQPAPAPTITPQLPWLSQQLNQVQQNQLNQVQQNQLLASLLTTPNPNSLMLQQQSQPLNLLQQQATLLQQQMAQNTSNSASNSNPLTAANNAASTAREKGEHKSV